MSSYPSLDVCCSHLIIIINRLCWSDVLHKVFSGAQPSPDTTIGAVVVVWGGPVNGQAHVTSDLFHCLTGPDLGPTRVAMTLSGLTSLTGRP